MKQPTAAQKRWMQRIAQYSASHGSFPKQDSGNCQLHHVKGRSFKHNKVAIGHWYVLPIEPKYHDVNSNNDFNVTHFKKRYEIEFGHQVDQFMAMAMTIKDEDGSLPFDNDVLHSIMDLKV